MPVEHLPIENPKELMEIVAKELEAVEKGLHVIGSEIPVDDKTSIGMLCHDENSQLVIVQPTLKEDKDMIIHALKCADYVDNFKMMLAAMNPKAKIDTAKPPRVIILMPECSEETVKLVKHIKDVRIDIYTWEYLKIGEHKGLHIEPILISSQEKTEKPPVLEPKKEPEKPKKKKDEVKKTKPETKEKEEPKPETEIKKEPEKVKPEPEPKPETKQEPSTEPEEPPKPEPSPVVEQPSLPPKPKEEKKEQKRKLKLF